MSRKRDAQKSAGGLHSGGESTEGAAPAALKKRAEIARLLRICVVSMSPCSLEEIVKLFMKQLEIGWIAAVTIPT